MASAGFELASHCLFKGCYPRNDVTQDGIHSHLHQLALKEEDVETPSVLTKKTVCTTKTESHLRPLGLPMTYYLI